MNERTRDMYAEAFQVFNKCDENYEEMFSKFTELIVKECCNVLQGEDIRYGGYGYNQGFLHKKIKEHFGVE